MLRSPWCASTRFRNLLNETDLDKRVQYMVEVLFQVRKDKWKNHPAVKEELDLVEEEDQITHEMHLDQDHDVETVLNIFKHDANYEENEEAYRKLKAEILGEESGSESGSSAGDESSDEEEEEEEKRIEIQDQTNADLVQLRKTIYLPTIMSSADFEECAHKMMKVTIPEGLEHELPNMIIECCSQERTYLKFYGGLGERFARLNRLWQDLFANAFTEYYEKIHRYETNKLRNIARFFGHMISTEAIPYQSLGVIKLTEDETTSSSRIFIKILFPRASGSAWVAQASRNPRRSSCAAASGWPLPPRQCTQHAILHQLLYEHRHGRADREYA